MRVDKAQFAAEWKGIVLAITAPPPGTTPRFNEAAEWRPWSQAPTDSVDDRTIASVTSWLPRFYQITPQIVLAGGAGIHP